MADTLILERPAVAQSLRINVAGVAIDNVTTSEAIERFDGCVTRGEPCYVVTPNVDVIVKLNQDSAFHAIYQGAALVFADGMPLIWASHYLNTPLKERVAGSDMFIQLCGMAARRGYGVFFLGALPGVAAQAAEALQSRFPGLKVCGAYSPPFGFDKDAIESGAIVDKIRAAKPDILFVGLGSPKQERWIARYYQQYRVPVSMAVGASFDFVAGNVRRAPLWMQNAGLEWFWRLMMEPGRLWRRYLIEDPKFFYLVWKQKKCSQ